MTYSRPTPKQLVLSMLATTVLTVLLSPLFACAAKGYSHDWELYRDGDKGLLAVLWINLDEGYHVYGNPPGDTGLPTTLSISLPDGTKPTVLYPPGKQEPDLYDPTQTVYTYYDRTPLFVPLGNIATAEATLTGKLTFLLCTDASCRPVRLDVQYTPQASARSELPDAQGLFWYAMKSVSAPAPSMASEASTEAQPDAPTAQRSAEWDITPRYFQSSLEVSDIWLALVFAFIAGLILNFMPCVLPVVSLKLSGLISGAGTKTEDARLRVFREHNIFFSLGVLVYFLFLGGLLSSLGLAWGQIFQSPTLLLALASGVFALGLSLFGLYDLPIIDLKAGSSANGHKSQAFFTGIIATLLATPCSGPFLGGVLGWVLLQPPLTVLIVFLCIGIGMSTPFLLMALRPGLVRFFPKPGAWMVYLETGVGFFLMATCIYLLSILPAAMHLQAAVFFLAIAFAAWMWGKWTSLHHSRIRRILTRAAAIALIIAAWLFITAPTRPGIAWQDFDEAAFRAQLGETPMLVDFTAEWCPNCKALEHTTLADANMRTWREQYGFILIKADLTHDNPPVQRLLKALGSQSIPVVAIFPAGEDAASPIVLRDIFTKSQMEAALRQAFGK